MNVIAAERVRVGSVAELKQRGCTVISAGGHGIAVFALEQLVNGWRRGFAGPEDDELDVPIVS